MGLSPGDYLTNFLGCKSSWLLIDFLELCVYIVTAIAKQLGTWNVGKNLWCYSRYSYIAKNTLVFFAVQNIIPLF